MIYNYIAIEGTLGAGKTTLASRIANDFNGKLVLEEFEADKNPFLPKFYKEPGKYSFQVEMTFLALRYQQLKDKSVPWTSSTISSSQTIMSQSR